MTALVHLSHDRRRRLAQAGLLGRGVLYCLVGVLAVQLALGGGGSSQQASQQGALQLLAGLPGGTFLVLLLGIGLLGYAAWRFSQFLFERAGDDVKDKVERISYLVRGVIYLGFGGLAIMTAFGGGSSSGGGGGGGGGGSSQSALTSMVMRDVPGGRILVGLVGLIIIGVGLYQAYQAFSDDFMEELRTGEMTPTERTWTRRIGVAGHSSRAVVYSLIGIFVMQAAITFSPQQSKGLGGALQEISQQSFGPYLLGLVAIGLFLYGLYAIIRARYVDVSE